MKKILARFGALLITTAVFLLCFIVAYVLFAGVYWAIKDCLQAVGAI